MATLDNVPLDPEQLNETDELILDYLANDGRATPAVLELHLQAERGEEQSRSYINQRLIRLAEHDHVGRVLGQGVYELKDDPREVGDAE